MPTKSINREQAPNVELENEQKATKEAKPGKPLAAAPPLQCQTALRADANEPRPLKQ